ncbi:unknown [Coprobacillus sp. CAG:698]|nr:unknown [Coprobacillus sp. CAG:698]
MKLIKFLLKTILGLICLVLIFIVTIMILLSGSGNNPPLEAYKNNDTTENIITNSLNESLTKMKDTYSIDLSLDSDKLNKIIFNVIRDYFNSDYDPINGQTDKEKYINSFLSIPSNVPLVGGKELILKNAYVEFDNDKLIFNSDIDLFGFIKSRIYIEMTLNSDKDSIYLAINKLKLGKISMLNKNNTFALSIYKSFLDIEAINSTLKEKNIPLTIDCDNLKIICLKKDLKNYIKNLVNTDDEFAKEFISIITDEKYDMLNANINNNSLNISLSLENLKTDDLLVDESIKKEIDKNSFITNKTQNLLLSTLTKENRITFSYLEFNRLIFTQTNSYKDLSFEPILYGETKILCSIEGIIMFYKDNDLYIKLIIDVSGLKTICLAKCIYTQINDLSFKICLSDTITLGKDLEISSSFLDTILKNTFDSLKFAKYDDKTSSIIINSSLFDKFLTNSSISSTLKVSKIYLDEYGLSCIIDLTDEKIKEKVETISKSLENILENKAIDLSKLDSSDDTQKEAIETINNSLNNISSIIKDPGKELTSDDTDKLIEAISSLSSENQKALASELENSFTEEDKQTLEELYNDLFK